MVVVGLPTAVLLPARSTIRPSCMLDQPPKIHDQLVVGGKDKGDVLFCIHVHQQLHQARRFSNRDWRSARRPAPATVPRRWRAPPPRAAAGRRTVPTGRRSSRPARPTSFRISMARARRSAAGTPCSCMTNSTFSRAVSTGIRL